MMTHSCLISSLILSESLSSHHHKIKQSEPALEGLFSASWAGLVTCGPLHRWGLLLLRRLKTWRPWPSVDLIWSWSEGRCVLLLVLLLLVLRAHH